jgi:hypothetical protein
VLGNSRAKLDKEFHLKSAIQLTSIQDEIDRTPEQFTWTQHNEVSHEEKTYLTGEYFDCLNTLSKIRAECVWRLKDTLFGEIKEKAIGMDKNKSGQGLIQ